MAELTGAGLKARILAGRKAVDDYRLAHSQLHAKPWHKGIPEEHTPPLDTLLVEFSEQGFGALQDFFAASEELKAEELGFISREDFETRASEADREEFEGMWQ